MATADLAAETRPGLRAVGYRGAVATAHPLASSAALAILDKGGNAADAAITAASVLGVVQPMMSGLGGDSFVLFRSGRTGKITSVNGSGPAPRGLTPDRFASGRLPERGLLSASVPGAVDVLCVTHRHFGSGRFTLAELLAPAIRHAAEGAPVTPAVAAFFAQNADLLAQHDTTQAVYLREGHVPATGDVLRQPDLARTLEQIARGGASGFYRGEFARRLVAQSEAAGGAFAAEDLAGYRCEMLEPLTLQWRGLTVQTNPPVGQGIVLLQALGIAEASEKRTKNRSSADEIHGLIEAVKLAFADRNKYVGDPHFIANPLDRLMHPDYLRKRAAHIRTHDVLQAEDVDCGLLGDGDTTCFTVADGDGNVAAYITSLSTPFGAAEIVAGTGVLLNNRAGRGFTLDAKAPNRLAPGKRTMSTLHVYMVCDGTDIRLAGGTSGGDGQPQTNLQILTSVFEKARDIGDAILEPRWELSPGTDPASLGKPFELRVDPRYDADVLDNLKRRGHVVSDRPLGMLGAAQAVMFRKDGAMIAAADLRADGSALALP